MWGEDIYAGVADTAEPHTRRSPVTDSSQVGDCARSPPPQDTLLGAWGSGGRAARLSPQPLSFVQCRCCWPPFRLFIHLFRALVGVRAVGSGGGEGLRFYSEERCRRRAELGKDWKSFHSPGVVLTLSLVCGEEVVVEVRLGEWQALGGGGGGGLPCKTTLRKRPPPPTYPSRHTLGGVSLCD